MNPYVAVRTRVASFAAALLLAIALAADAAEPATDPFPRVAAGWGPELGGGRMASRWAEDLPAGSQLALRAELRLRQVAWCNAPGRAAGETTQGQLRAALGADWRPHPALRIYGELATGDVSSERDDAPANLRNAVSVQQLFVESRAQIGPTLVGVMAGRQEFADGPRQLVSLSDGPNLHRTWNGLRAYVHARRWRIGAFDFRATWLGAGAFDEGVNPRETLSGLNASIVVGDREASSVEPFWFHTHRPAHRVAGRLGHDDRDSIGFRWWARRGAMKYDWTLARQSGRTVGDRRIDAWGLFAVQSLALTDSGWNPRLTGRIDLTSGGGAWSDGAVRTFHPLYASSSYVSEGQLLALGNLLVFAPGVTVTPTPRTTMSFDVGHVRRWATDDAVYATATRAYANTQNVPGHHVGELLRVGATWSPDPQLSLRFTLEHLRAGSVLRQAGHTSASFAFFDLTLRF